MSAFQEAMLLSIRAQIESLVSQREAMIAANKYREGQGLAPAYDEEAFRDNAKGLAYALPDPRDFQ